MGGWSEVAPAATGGHTPRQAVSPGKGEYAKAGNSRPGRTKEPQGTKPSGLGRRGRSVLPNRKAPSEARNKPDGEQYQQLNHHPLYGLVNATHSQACICVGVGPPPPSNKITETKRYGDKIRSPRSGVHIVLQTREDRSGWGRSRENISPSSELFAFSKSVCAV